MKILIINTTDQGGGAAYICFSLGDALRGKGYHIRYLVGYKQTSRRDVDTLNFPKFLPVNRWTNKFVLYLRHLRSYLLSDDISYGKSESLFHHPWYKEADLIHIHNRHGNFISLKTLAKALTVKPVIWTMEDVWPITIKSAIVTQPDLKKEKLSFYPPTMRWPTPRLQKQKRDFFKSSKLILISPSKWLQTQTEKVLQRPIRIIPHGIPLLRPDPAKVKKLKQFLNLSLNKKIALFTATKANAQDKGVEYFGQLANQFHTTHEFIWVGVKRTDNRWVKTLPYQTSQMDFINILSLADILIAPSKADIFGLVVLQAKSLGVPVLAFKTGGISELVSHQHSGYLARLNDYTDLETGFIFIADSLKKADTLNQTAIKSEYSIAKMAEAYQKLYDEAKLAILN